MGKDAPLPFDAAQSDKLLHDAGIDAVLVTSKHNIQYLLGGYRFFFFENFDALGISRYLPVLIYPVRRPRETVYLGNAQEDSEVENGRFWCETVEARFWGTLDTIDAAVNHLERLELGNARIGVELSFMPADAMDRLRARLPEAEFVDAHLPLERLRAVKTPAELAVIREASERVVDAMVTTFGAARAGITKQDLFHLLRDEETKRGVRFDFCQLTLGTSFNRAPNGDVLKVGDIVSLDSGGSYGGFFGDVCRMGVVGTPDQELIDCLSLIDEIQHLARGPVRAGAIGEALFDAVENRIAASDFAPQMSFVAHGMGIIGHEAPRLSDRGPVTYPASDAKSPLRGGMVLSIETTLLHPRRGFMKLEDTVVVTENGCEGFGDGGRGWNIISA